MNFQVLISTMNQANDKLITNMNVSTDAVVINQCEKNSLRRVEIEKIKVKWINSSLRGLSLSRNMAIANASASIGLLADDDIEYIDGYKEKIISQFLKFPKADIIAFQVKGIEKEFKKYHKKSRTINYINSMKISSVEIAFKIESIKQKNIVFNEKFGAGSKYIMGEENIFLYECLKKGLKIVYVPIKIANLHLEESSWFTGYNKKYFISKGAVFTAMSRKFALILILQFALRKYKFYKNNLTRKKVLKYMFEGRCEFLDELNNS